MYCSFRAVNWPERNDTFARKKNQFVSLSVIDTRSEYDPSVKDQKLNLFSSKKMSRRKKTQALYGFEWKWKCKEKEKKMKNKRKFSPSSTSFQYQTYRISGFYPLFCWHLLCRYFGLSATKDPTGWMHFSYSCAFFHLRNHFQYFRFKHNMIHLTWI